MTCKETNEKLALELYGDEVNKERFPLPNLGAELERCANELHLGSGICILRGLQPDRYSMEENTLLFLALASYIGDQRGVQNFKGAMLSAQHTQPISNINQLTNLSTCDGL